MTRDLEFEKYDNVSLYPAADEATVEMLFDKCDYYLDINRYDEIVDAVYKAYLHNHVIMGFGETLHNDNYVDGDNIYAQDTWQRMVDNIKCGLAILLPLIMMKNSRLKKIRILLD